jgi:transcriptional regulator of met regulon
MDKTLMAVREASISIACLLDEPTKVTVKDLEHLQNQITVIENFLDPFTIKELEEN